jgi:site-specific DNA-methyltransferase (adenine-specific)
MDATLYIGDMRARLAEIPDESIDAVVTDPPYHLTTGKKGGTGIASLNPNSPAGRSRIGTGFMGCGWDSPDSPPIDADFAHWLAGFVDGEGCFSVHKKTVNGCETYDCQFSLALRADDAPIVEEIQQRLGGIGTIARREPQASNPQVRYCISSQSDCLFLREIFTVFPLRAKKRRDFIAWSHALDCWLEHQPREWADMAYYRDALMAVKCYGSTFSPELLWHYRWARLCLRVAKPGAHLIAFGGTRTVHRLMAAIEDAGWELRDTLLWMFGSGFPKSSNQEGKWEGWGSALKPAYEPIILARKPLIGTIPENLERYGVGALNIDGCRIETTDDLNGGAYAERGGREPMPGDPRDGAALGMFQAGKTADKGFVPPPGRWPANVLHDGSDEVVAVFPDSDGQLVDASSSRKFQNVYSPMARGNGRDGEPSANDNNDGAVGFKMKPGARRVDSGSAARFFWCPKASRADRNEGLQGMPKRPVNWSSGDESPGTFQSEGTEREQQNFHPTVKPTELMQYLCRLVAPRGATILDPFMGSGSTGKAAVLEGMNFIGFELDADYAKIAQRRIVSRDPLFTRVNVHG